jgi:hypothetical protein
VAATAARLLAPSGGKVVAFTAVPREGYDLPGLKDRIGDEGPLAALTAAMHPNVEHVMIRSGQGSPLDALDRSFFLFERPILNICNNVWVSSINDEVRRRGLTVLLSGQLGNMSVSYNGGELLAELVGAGQWIQGDRLARGTHGVATANCRGSVPPCTDRAGGPRPRHCAHERACRELADAKHHHPMANGPWPSRPAKLRPSSQNDRGIPLGWLCIRSTAALSEPQ